MKGIGDHKCDICGESATSVVRDYCESEDPCSGFTHRKPAGELHYLCGRHDRPAAVLSRRALQNSLETDMSYSDDRMAMIFNEWARRYSESPDEFGEMLDGDGNLISDYGQRCTAYFKRIANEMDAAGVLPVAPPASA